MTRAARCACETFSLRTADEARRSVYKSPISCAPVSDAERGFAGRCHGNGSRPSAAGRRRFLLGEKSKKYSPLAWRIIFYFTTLASRGFSLCFLKRFDRLFAASPISDRSLFLSDV